MNFETLEFKVVEGTAEELRRNYPHTMHCACGDVLAASDEPLPAYLIDLLAGTPCSECAPPEEFAKMVDIS